MTEVDSQAMPGSGKDRAFGGPTQLATSGSQSPVGRARESCDLCRVYSSTGSSPESQLLKGFQRDVCGYLTRENNLRGYIAACLAFYPAPFVLYTIHVSCVFLVS